MRRMLKLSGLVILVTTVNVITMLALVGPTATTAGGPVARENGDVNGDSSIDIGDAIYLLTFLFGKGPEPVAIAGGGLTPEQEEILSHMSIEFLDDGQGGTVKTIRFSEVNVQIVNGLGATNGNPGDPDSPIGMVNGLGNLIVGYNELLPVGPSNDHTGSHNIVVGTDNNYTRWVLGLLVTRVLGRFLCWVLTFP